MKSKHSFKRALVTGSNKGLGKALVDLLQEKGIEVIHTERIELTGSRQKLLEIITEKKPDLVINNAGFGLYGNTVDLGIQEQLDMIEVNVKALVEISIHTAKTLLKAGKTGTVLNVSSAAAYVHSPMANVYHSTKAFVKSFSLGMDAELREQGIRVLCSCPGQFKSHFQERASKGLYRKVDLKSMSLQYAAKQVWHQIESGKRISLFNWFYKFLIGLTKILPDFIVEKTQKAEIGSRISH
ncbi:MAG: SDR family NAD(P)-dependent oxidoreductase [Verrucomicrobia bacterium]|nr:SDR family NAD(P)-dependent oxidoreductase [Verrucomicrobiota bacterium]